jgi:predicted metal-dependent phosphoesterase TrpH
MLRVISLILVLIGVIAGTLVDRVPDAPPAERGGYEVVQADLHVHSFFNDGLLSPFALVSQARQRGIHAIAITNHNQVFAAKSGRSVSRLIGGPTVFVGEEITAPGFHIGAVGINEHISWRQSAAEVIDEIHRQGGIAIAAHPNMKYRVALDVEAIRKLDGAEIMHPIAYASRVRWEQMRDFYRQATAESPSLTPIGSSDYHWFNSLGMCRTYIFVHRADESGILEALRDGRTVVYDVEGNAYGRPDLVQLLQEQPIPQNTRYYDYSGAGVIDIVTRVCGWCGLLGLLLFGRQKQDAEEGVS